MKTKRKQQGFFLNPYRFSVGGAAATEPDWANVALLIHGDARPFLDVSSNLRPVVNYGARCTLVSSAVNMAADSGLQVPAGSGIAVFGTGAWMMSAKVMHTSSNNAGVYARIFDSRTTVGGANNGLIFVIGSGHIPLLQINGTVYGTGTPAATLLSTDDTWYTWTASYDGAVLRLFRDGAVCWSHTVALNITNDGPITIGNTPDFINGIGNVRIREMMIAKGEAVYTAAHTSVVTWTDTGFAIEEADAPPATDVQLLLHGAGSNGSTAILDSSLYNRAVTVNGNAQISTAQARVGASSILFDGTGDFLTILDNAGFDFGTGAFCVELQARMDVTTRRILISNYLNSTNGFTLQQNPSGSNAGYVSWNSTGDGVDIDSVSSPLGTAAWKHIAVARLVDALKFASSILMFFFEGELVSAKVDTQSMASTQNLYVGRLGTVVTTADMDGYLQEIRVTKGHHVYGYSFVVQTGAHEDPSLADTAGWSPTYKNADIALSGSDLIATLTSAGAAIGSVLGGQARDASDDRYFEVTLSGDDINALAGIGKLSASLASNPGADADGYAVFPYSNQTFRSNAAVANPYFTITAKTVGFLYDADTGIIYYIPGGATKAGPVQINSGMSGTLYPCWGPGTSGAGARTGTLNADGPFTHGLPDGASAWGGTWNASDKDTDVVLSGSDLIATVTAALGSVRGTVGHSTGKHYFEITWGGPDNNCLLGFAKASATITNIYPGGHADSWAYYASNGTRWNNNGSLTITTVPTWPTTVGVWLKAGTLKFIVTGRTGPDAWTGLTGPFYPMWGPGTSGAGTRIGTINVTGSFVHGLPSGSTAWG